jgi:hypothetical protein
MPSTTNTATPPRTSRAKKPKPTAQQKAEAAPVPSEVKSDNPPQAATEQQAPPAAANVGTPPADGTATPPNQNQPESMFDNEPNTAPDAAKVDTAKVVDAASTTTDDDKSDEPVEVRIGSAMGRLERIPLAQLQGALKQFEPGIALLRGSISILPLQERMRATEGRCAPIIFQQSEDGEQLHLMAGIEAVACAQQLGLERVFVVTVAAEDAEAVHSHLATQAVQRPKSDDDDDLVYQVNAHYS